MNGSSGRRPPLCMADCSGLMPEVCQFSFPTLPQIVHNTRVVVLPPTLSPSLSLSLSLSLSPPGRLRRGLCECLLLVCETPSACVLSHDPNRDGASDRRSEIGRRKDLPRELSNAGEEEAGERASVGAPSPPRGIKGLLPFFHSIPSIRRLACVQT